MKKYLVHAMVMVILIIMSTACKKDKGAAPADEFIKAADFWAAHKVKEQTFTGNAETGFVITGEKGTKITFPANAFKDLAGAVVSGTVTITLTEILSKRDILLSGPMTESNGQLLISGGELQVLATKDGKVLVPGEAAIEVEVPQVMGAGDMQLFVQERRKQDQGTADNLLQNPDTWVPAPYAPFGMGPNTYIFTLPGFTWVNCDRFYNDADPKTTITVSPDFQDTNEVTDLQVMLVFKDITTVITLPYNYALQKFESYQNSLPVGLEAELVIIGKDAEGYIQFGTQYITISADQHIDAAIGRTPAADVEAFLDTVN